MREREREKRHDRVVEIIRKRYKLNARRHVLCVAHSVKFQNFRAYTLFSYVINLVKQSLGSTEKG